MKKFYGLLIILFVLVGCKAPFIAPKPHDIQNARTLNIAYDDVWSKVIDWCGKNGTPLKSIDKASGYISTEYDLKASVNYVDCGKAETVKAIGTVNFVIKKISENQTSLTINTFWRGQNYDVMWGYWDLDCYSNGVFEKKIFDYVESK